MFVDWWILWAPLHVYLVEFIAINGHLWYRRDIGWIVCILYLGRDYRVWQVYLIRTCITNVSDAEWNMTRWHLDSAFSGTLAACEVMWVCLTWSWIDPDWMTHNLNFTSILDLQYLWLLYQLIDASWTLLVCFSPDQEMFVFSCNLIIKLILN